VRADTNLAIKKCYFSIVSPFWSSWCEKVLCLFSGCPQVYCGTGKTADRPGFVIVNDLNYFNILSV
jgi:hypothetical protein